MRQSFRSSAAAAALLLASMGSQADTDAKSAHTPPSVRIQKTDSAGLVYADERGHTLYVFEGGSFGAAYGISGKCDDTKYEKAGPTILTFVYYLPEADKRPTCAQAWPPFLASADAKPVGDWSVMMREDGRQQWAYKGLPVIRSWLDEAPGDVNGYSSVYFARFGRFPLKVEDELPAGVTTVPTAHGLALALNEEGDLLYVRAPGDATKGFTKVSFRAACDAECRSQWQPFRAAEISTATAPFAIEDRDGLRQWSYKGQLLFVRKRMFKDTQVRLERDPAWRLAIVQPLAEPPSNIKTVMTSEGEAYADHRGHTLYTFDCTEETPERQFCDVKGSTQTYRMGICGGPAKCRERFQPLFAKEGAKAPNRVWTVVKIDPENYGRMRDESQPGLYAWAYHGRPVYTYIGDEEPGDNNAHLMVATGVQWGYRMVSVGDQTSQGL